MLYNSLILPIATTFALALVTVDDLVLSRRGIDGDSRAIFNNLIELRLWWKLTLRFEFLFNEVVILVQTLNIFFNDPVHFRTRIHHLKIMAVVPELANRLYRFLIWRGRLVEMFGWKRCILLTIGVHLLLQWLNLAKWQIINIDPNINMLFLLVHFISLFLKL